MPTYNKFNQFVEDKAKGVHNLAVDQLVVALSNTKPNRTDSVLADIVEIDYTNLDSRMLTTTSAAQTDGTFKLMIDDLVLTAADAVPEFQYVTVYNDAPTSPEDPVISWADYGKKVNMIAGQTFDITFDQTNGFHTET